MSFKKKQILSATLVVALVAAVAVNWYYSKPGAAVETTVNETLSDNNLGDTVLVAGSVQSTETATTDNQSTTEGAEQTANEETEKYFASAKLKRTNTHDELKDNLEKMIKQADGSESTKNKISSLLESYENNLKAETDAENLIEAKTGGQCLVIINASSAQVVLQKGLLNDTTLLQISEIFEKNTKISSENLTIIEAK